MPCCSLNSARCGQLLVRTFILHSVLSGVVVFSSLPAAEFHFLTLFPPSSSSPTLTSQARCTGYDRQGHHVTHYPATPNLDTMWGLRPCSPQVIDTASCSCLHRFGFCSRLIGRSSSWPAKTQDTNAQQKEPEKEHGRFSRWR